MEVKAITRNVRMSAQKMREVVRQIQGMNAVQAQAVLAVVPRKSARFVAKTLKSALANAEDLKTNKPEYSGLKVEFSAGQGSGGPDSQHPQTDDSESAWLVGADTEAELPYQNRFIGQLIAMGQKTNPIGLRIAVNKDWRSKWYAEKKEFGKLLAEDRKIRDILKKKLESASVPKIQIDAQRPAAVSPFLLRVPVWSLAAKARKLTRSRKS